MGRFLSGRVGRRYLHAVGSPDRPGRPVEGQGPALLSGPGGGAKAIVLLAEDDTPDWDGFKDLWANNEEAFKDMRLGEEGYVSVHYALVNDDGEEGPPIRFGG